MQRDVVATLQDIGAHPKEEWVSEEGYNIDAVVLWEGKRIAVEVDGPHHYLSG